MQTFKKYFGISSIALGSMLLVFVLMRGLLVSDPQQEFKSQPVGAVMAAASSTVVNPALVVNNYKRRDLIPQRIEIPAIGVNAEVVDVGLGKTGNMAVPLAYADTGWYRYGPAPGETGSAVIDGHVNNGFGLAAVFADLEKLKKGDSIFIYAASGKKLQFAVTDMQIYPADEAPRDLIFSRNDGSYLNLITCSGSFDPSTESYDHRAVVYSTLVPSAN